MEQRTAKRILVLGSGGAGKSTLARALGEATGIPVVHLDSLYWQPSWTPTDRQAWRDVVERETGKDAWIMDGNYVDTLEQRLSRAQLAIDLQYSRVTCLLGVLRRIRAMHGRVRPDMGAGCPERFDASFLRWVWNFPKQDGARVRQLLAAHSKVPCVVLHNRRAARAFVMQMRRESGGGI